MRAEEDRDKGASQKEWPWGKVQKGQERGQETEENHPVHGRGGQRGFGE